MAFGGETPQLRYNMCFCVCVWAHTFTHAMCDPMHAKCDPMHAMRDLTHTK